MRIQHNILAMNAYRNYNTNTSALSKNLEKLSSGYKINRAGDDAAGLAISEKMRAQITGLNAAQKNVKDGISLVKTAEGAMQEIQDMLNRMDYLATQSANGTYDNEVDRANLQKEVDALRDEIDRIADSANFNGINLLDGSQQGVKASGAWTETIEASTSKGIDRILKDVLGKTEPSYDKNDTKTVLDLYSPTATKASFTIDLSKLQLSVTANTTGSGAISTGTLTGAQLGDVKINIGGKEITVKGSQLASSIKAVVTATKASVTTITGAQWASAAVNSIKAAAGGSQAVVEINGVWWKASVSGSELKFTQVSFPESMDKANADFKVNVAYVAGSATTATISLTGDVTPGTQNTHMGSPQNGGRGASTVFKMDLDDIVDGSVIKLGDNNYVLKVGTNGKGQSAANAAGVTVPANAIQIDLSSLGDDFTLDQALTKIASTVNSTAFTVDKADGSGKATVNFKVGVSNDANHPGIAIMRATAPTTAADAVFTSVDKLAEFFGITNPGGTREHAAVIGSGGLTLQIGDTSDDYNQMTVNIGDMHVDSMGFDLDKKGNITTAGKSIKDIDISSQSGAKEAIDTIKNAINYVSSVRGDLGAIQNRLEHTANNLSVMAENIQDAESTIRDTDIAEEMMSYTKNNILVQSAQAMLAQANAVPQGVLQLLG